MSNYDNEILKPNFNLDKFWDRQAKKNREKYPEEMYEQAMIIFQYPEDPYQMEKIDALVKKYKYKPC